MGAPTGAFAIAARADAAERKQQLFLRGMVKGNLAERDRLLTYTIGEFYQEFSLFLTECEIKEKEMEKLRSKKAK